MGARSYRETTNNDNLVFIVGDANEILQYFNVSEIERLYLNFSDPWRDRKKWHKRRLTHRNFLKSYENILKTNGDIHFKTDNKELFNFSLNEFSSELWQLSNISLDLHKTEFHEKYNIMTEYEERFSSKGLPIYRCEAKKIRC